MTSALEPPARGCRGAGRARWSRSEMPFLGFHSHVTVSELPWPPHPHSTSSLPTHNPGLIRKTETCSRKGLVAENTAGWTSGPLAMKTSIVPLPGPAGPHLGPPAPALKRTAAGGGGRADGAVERASQGVSRTGATACNRNWGAHSAPQDPGKAGCSSLSQTGETFQSWEWAGRTGQASRHHHQRKPSPNDPPMHTH